jgi:peptide/nickel transport system permease protein
VRAEALSIRGRDFILAARAIGIQSPRIVLRHVLPNAMPVIIVTASLGLGFVILAEAALDFIGLGIRPPTPSWGNMLANAQTYFYQSPTLVVAPGAAIVLTVIAANMIGNALRDAFDPRLRQ